MEEEQRGGEREEKEDGILGSLFDHVMINTSLEVF